MLLLPYYSAFLSLPPALLLSSCRYASHPNGGRKTLHFTPLTADKADCSGGKKRGTSCHSFKKKKKKKTIDKVRDAQ